MEPLPSFRDVPAADRQLLFSKKLQLSTFTFDFMDATRHVREKELKRQTLLELVDYVNTGQVRTLFDLWDERLWLQLRHGGGGSRGRTERAGGCGTSAGGGWG
jgi:hypothetical protein